MVTGALILKIIQPKFKLELALSAILIWLPAR
jgi:hypothetical protein